jgi:hypothetical protein
MFHVLRKVLRSFRSAHPADGRWLATLSKCGVTGVRQTLNAKNLLSVDNFDCKTPFRIDWDTKHVAAEAHLITGR